VGATEATLAIVSIVKIYESSTPSYFTSAERIVNASPAYSSPGKDSICVGAVVFELHALSSTKNNAVANGLLNLRNIIIPL
jgi:hypothetical protein